MNGLKSVYPNDNAMLVQRYFLFTSFLNVFHPINNIVLYSQSLSLITVLRVLALRALCCNASLFIRVPYCIIHFYMAIVIFITDVLSVLLHQ